MKAIGLASAFLAIFLIAGCAMHEDNLPSDPEKRIAAVKKITQDAEARAVALVPKSDVKNVDQLPTGALLSCSSGYQWTGGIKVQLQPGVDGKATQARLAEAAKEHEFSVSQDKVLTGNIRFELIDREGVQLLMTVWNDGTLIDITSASPCVSLPDDFRVPSVY